ELQIGTAELAVRSRIAEAPSELLAQHFDRYRVGGGSIEMYPGPDLRPHQYQPDEQERGGAGPHGLQAIVAVVVDGAAAIVAKLHNHQAKRKLCQYENDPADDERSHELLVIGNAVGVDR